MGLLKLIKYVYIVALLFILYLCYAPNLLDIRPQPKTLKVFKGSLKTNELLSGAEKLYVNKFEGPESLVIHKGVIYTGVADGQILAIKDGTIKVFATIASDSRVLGLRVHNSKLLAVDCFNGLYSVDLETGKSELLFSSVDGKKMLFPDDFDVDSSGKIYLSDASQRWGLNHVALSFLEHENTGRVIEFDPQTKKSKVLVEGLKFSNGIQISHDKKSLLIAETMEQRVMQYHLEGPRKGHLDVFVDVPGEPDNIRPSSSGGYWVALNRLTDESSVGFMERVATYQLVRKCLANFFHVVGQLLEKINTVYPTMPLIEMEENVKKLNVISKSILRRCAVVELNAKGKIIRSLQSSDIAFCRLSEVMEHEGYLYIGSYVNPYLAKVKL